MTPRYFTPKALHLSLFCGAALALSACGGGETASIPAPVVEQVQSVTLADVIANPRRAKDTARDQFRHPQGTLEFFEIAPGQTVAEIWPGWYTDIIAPYLAANDGQYVAVFYPEGVNESLDERMVAYKEKYGDSDVYGTISYGALWKDYSPMLPPESIDTVLTFRNFHSFMSREMIDQVLEEAYAALKPGGTLGVVAHRLPETATQDPSARNGYVQESYIKDLAKRAGFEFVASSEVNANPLDTADHPMGVWTLPPRSRAPKEGTPEAADFDAEAYKNIGESDRATLKFRKPL